MRLIAVIVAFVVAAAALFGAVALLIVSLPRADTWALVLGSAAAPFVAYGPLVLGCLTAREDARSSSSSAPDRRWFAVIVAVEIAAAVLIMVVAVLAGSGPLVPAVFVGGCAALTALALRVGPAVRGYDQAHPLSDDPWVPIDRRLLRLRVVAVAVAFAGGFAVAELLALLLQLTIDHRLAFDPEELVLDFAAAFFASAVVSAVASSGWQRLLREVTGREVGSARFLTGVVVKGWSVPLTPADSVRAAAYAEIGWVVMSFQLAYLTFFYCAIALSQSGSLAAGTLPPFSIVLLVVIVAVVIALLPVQLVRIRRTYRYARQHAEVARAFVAARPPVEPPVAGSTASGPPS